MNYNFVKDKEEIIKKIKEVLSKYDVSFAIIFGSFVLRNYFRDIDIVVKGNIDIYELKDDLESLGFEFDVKKWDSLDLKFKFIAIKYGIPIIFNKDDFLKEKYRVIREYLDFQPIIERYNKYYLELIK